ncbi:hypothetical protein BDW27_107324 [Nocardiopsis sp. L17-MgMaSL7]|nr:hypothetical protein BDW27_107324 [Nocardiopsis sp. L17-MgMaSL7]
MSRARSGLIRVVARMLSGRGLRWTALRVRGHRGTLPGVWRAGRQGLAGVGLARRLRSRDRTPGALRAALGRPRGHVGAALSEMSHSGVAAGGSGRASERGSSLLRAAVVRRRLRTVGSGVLRGLGAAVCSGNALLAGAALRGLGELAVRGRARSGRRRLRATRTGVRRELWAGGARGGRTVRPLRSGCGMLAVRLGGRPEQVPTVACLRLERSSVWAVLRRVRMGADGSLRRLWEWDWVAARRGPWPVSASWLSYRLGGRSAIVTGVSKVRGTARGTGRIPAFRCKRNQRAGEGRTKHSRRQA